MSRPQLIIFDCDGVLVDSEPVANRILGQMLSELGLDLTQEQIFQNFVGYPLPHCLHAWSWRTRRRAYKPALPRG